jgi:hypothetical protein
VSTINPYVPPSQSSAPPPPPPASGAPGTSLDFGRALGFFFQDPNWVQKLLIGSLFTILSMFLIGTVFVAGYAVRLLRRTARGEAYPLPEWDDLGGMFAEGLAAIGAYLLYLLPAVVGMAVIFVPIALLDASGSDPSPAVFVVMIPLFLLAAVVFLAVLLFFPAAFIRLAVEERFGAALELDANWSLIRRNLSNYLLAIAAFLVANFIAQFAILLFCIGILPATFWSQCVGAYALGEVAFRDRG